MFFSTEGNIEESHQTLCQIAPRILNNDIALQQVYPASKQLQQKGILSVSHWCLVNHQQVTRFGNRKFFT